EEGVFVFQQCDVAIVSRDRPRHVEAGRSPVVLHFLYRVGDNSRLVMSRRVAPCRSSDFVNLGDVSCDRSRWDEVLVAEWSFLSPAVEVALETVPLNRPCRARVSGMLVTYDRIVNGESVLVGVCRSLSRDVVRHMRMISRNKSTRWCYPQNQVGNRG